jgi:hypothetical protein
MRPHDTDPRDSASLSPAEPAVPAIDPAAPPDDRRATVSTWLMALAAALLAGIASWLFGEATYQSFKASEAAASQKYDFTAVNRETAIANGRNGALAFGALGGLLGLGLGVAGGLSRRSVRGALQSAVVGLILGAAAGALPSFAVMPWQWRHRNDDPSSTNLLAPLLIHGGLWCGLGAAAGLAYGLGRGGLRPRPLLEGMLGGLVGAAIGTVSYEMVGAMAFPLGKTVEPFSSTASTRLLARLSVAVFTALGAVVMLHLNRSRDVKAIPSIPHPS